MCRRVSLICMLVACATVFGPVAAAGASDATLRATVRQDLPSINRSQAKILDGVATYQQTHSTSPLVKAIKAQNRNLAALKATLSGETASSAAGRKGKAELITGLGLIVASNKTLASLIQKHATGKSGSKARLKAAIAEAAQGNADLNAGGKLLKV